MALILGMLAFSTSVIPFHHNTSSSIALMVAE
jgi:hypothetical protein